MGVVDWISPVLSFVGGGLGAALGYRSAAASDRQADRQSRRDEWGRRFTTALEAFFSDDGLKQTVGQTMLEHLFDSDLASADDRLLARGVLTVDATDTPTIRRILTGNGADSVDFVESSSPTEEAE